MRRGDRLGRAERRGGRAITPTTVSARCRDAKHAAWWCSSINTCEVELTTAWALVLRSRKSSARTSFVSQLLAACHTCIEEQLAAGVAAADMSLAPSAGAHATPTRWPCSRGARLAPLAAATSRRAGRRTCNSGPGRRSPPRVPTPCGPASGTRTRTACAFRATRRAAAGATPCSARRTMRGRAPRHGCRFRTRIACVAAYFSIRLFFNQLPSATTFAT